MIALVADALHRVAGGPHSLVDVEEGCYCRRIATEDGTVDGPQSPYWSSIGGVYDPKEWGVADPTLCTLTASDLIDDLRTHGIRLVKDDE